MNRIELKALNWIKASTNCPESAIKFSNNTSPDFLLPNGEAFEAKFHRRHDPVILWPSQWLELLQYPKCKLLIFHDEYGDPEAVISVIDMDLLLKRHLEEASISLLALPSYDLHYSGIRFHFCRWVPGSQGKQIPRPVFLLRMKALRGLVPEGKSAPNLAAHLSEWQFHKLTKLRG